MPKFETPENRNNENLRKMWTGFYNSAIEAGHDNNLARLMANQGIADYKKARRNLNKVVHNG